MQKPRTTVTAKQPSAAPFVVRLPKTRVGTSATPRSVRKRVPSRQSGFSLIEVTIAIGVLAFAAVSILGLIPNGLATGMRSHQTMIASRLAAEVQSELQQVGLASLPTDTTFFDVDGRVATNSSTAVFEVYRTIEDCPVPGATSPKLKRVVVQVVKNPARTSLTRAAGGLVTVPPGLEERTYRFHVTAP